MTRLIKNRVFSGRQESLWQLVMGCEISDLEIENCVFQSCSLAGAQSVEKRTRVRNVILKNCRVCSCVIFHAIIEDTIIENMTIENDHFIFGAAFRHVTLRGDFGAIVISNEAHSSVPKNKQLKIAEANRAFYVETDWALDISQANFEECDIRGIPSNLIKRDPTTQFVVKRDKLLASAWQQIDFADTCWADVLQNMIDFGWDDIVLVAPKRARDFSADLKVLSMLRSLGIAEPD